MQEKIDLDRDLKRYFAEIIEDRAVCQEEAEVINKAIEGASIDEIKNVVREDLRRILDLNDARLAYLRDIEEHISPDEIDPDEDIAPTSFEHFFSTIPREELKKIT